MVALTEAKSSILASGADTQGTQPKAKAIPMRKEVRRPGARFTSIRFSRLKKGIFPENRVRPPKRTASPPAILQISSRWSDKNRPRLVATAPKAVSYTHLDVYKRQQYL